MYVVIRAPSVVFRLFFLFAFLLVTFNFLYLIYYFARGCA